MADVGVPRSTQRTPLPQVGSSGLKIVSWNMAANTTSKAKVTHERAWHYLAALDPDVALLQEAKPPPWSTDIWQVVMAPVPSWGWGTAVLAKYGRTLTAFEPDPVTAWDSRALIATATIALGDGAPLLVGSVHAPLMHPLPEEYLAGLDPAAIKVPSHKTAVYYDVPYALFRSRVGERFLVSGDWNVSPDLWDEHHPASHEHEFFDRARGDGWVDCYRRFHDVEGQTWFRKGNRPYQMDHAFCDPRTASTMTRCDIDPYAAESLKLSDHAPLVMTLAYG